MELQTEKFKSSPSLSYFDAISESMTWLGSQSDTFFLGQAVGVPGTFMFNTLKGVRNEKRLELPVNESLQMQMSLGLSIAGFTPISIYPRLNFLTLAMGDMSNSLDKFPAMTGLKTPPRVIVRSAVGPDSPVHPGHQHIGDFTESFKALFETVAVFKIETPRQAMDAYQTAYNDKSRSYLLIEVGNAYAAK